jgi:carboxyl-terminal processing protease
MAVTVAYSRYKTVLFSAISVLLLGGVFCAGYAFGQASRPAIEQVTELSGKETPPGIDVKTDFSPFWSAWNVLNLKYVPATSTSVATDQERIWGAISGLASSLKDPYTVFMPPEEAKLFESEISGNFEGVGMEIGIKDEVLTVVAPLKSTPAERAGILPGDKILKINSEVSTSMKVEQAVKLIRGKRGTEVALTLFREGKKEPFEVKVMRDVIDIPTLDTEVKNVKTASDGAQGSGSGLQENGVFIIKLYNFSLNSPKLFRDALAQFEKSGSTKLLLDLRGNPGGFLEAAVDMASWFLPEGKVVVTEDAGGKSQTKVHRSKGYNVFNKRLKMVILVNAGSASASEILAGALQQHGIATLVGAQTFGKGSVQELVKLTADTSLKVTVARWLTPDGTSISDGGLTPDIEVKMTLEDVEKKRDPQMDEAIKLLTTDN